MKNLETTNFIKNDQNSDISEDFFNIEGYDSSEEDSNNKLFKEVLEVVSGVVKAPKPIISLPKSEFAGKRELKDKSGQTPCDFFRKIFTSEFIKNIVLQTQEH
jgi:hypothetical protein